MAGKAARRSFTRFDQVTQLVSASEADPDLGYIARLLAFCSLPRSNPGNRIRYVRRNGPFTLVMTTTGLHKLPHGSNPRLMLAWISTEAGRGFSSSSARPPGAKTGSRPWSVSDSSSAIP